MTPSTNYHLPDWTVSTQNTIAYLILVVRWWMYVTRAEPFTLVLQSRCLQLEYLFWFTFFYCAGRCSAEKSTYIDMKMCLWYSHLLEYHFLCATLCIKAIWHKIYCTVHPVEILKDRGNSFKMSWMTGILLSRGAEVSLFLRRLDPFWVSTHFWRVYDGARVASTSLCVQ
jgi:hypothetical protein